jgi:uncharacterized protein involved in cysteine biosynthesis
MGYNYITSRGYEAMEDAGNCFGVFLVILVVIALVVGIAALFFWLFTWAIATLFAYHIAYTWINFCAYFVLSWIFGGKSSSSSSKK